MLFPAPLDGHADHCSSLLTRLPAFSLALSTPTPTSVRRQEELPTTPTKHWHSPTSNSHVQSVAGNPVVDTGKTGRSVWRVRIRSIWPHLACCTFYLPWQTPWAVFSPSRDDPCIQSPEQRRLSHAIHTAWQGNTFQTLLKCHLLYENVI